MGCHPCGCGFALRQSGDRDWKTNFSFRPMTLRRHAFACVAFRQSVGLDHAWRGFRRSDFAPSCFRMISLLSATLATLAQFSFRSRALRHHAFA
jgi:hypothetical protein